VLVFYHLPESRIVSEKAARWRDAALALAAGLLMTALVLVGTPENFPPTSAFFAEHSVTRGHGRNIVNVILVDFRGLDTLGEITVLAVAAIGVHALLKLRRRADGDPGHSHDGQGPARAGDGSPREGAVGEALSDGDAGRGRVPAAEVREGESP
jgi:hypothetical protein